MKALIGVLLVIAAACGLSLVLVSSCSSRTHTGPTMRDPGPGRSPDVQGVVVVKALDSVRIAGTDIRLPSLGIPAFCDMTSNHCYGFVLLANDGRTAEHMSWWAPERYGRYTLNTNQLRFDASSVVVDGGISIPLSDRFTIRGCEVNTRPALATSSTGVTLSLDGKTAKVTTAACNGTS